MTMTDQISKTNPDDDSTHSSILPFSLPHSTNTQITSSDQIPYLIISSSNFNRSIHLRSILLLIIYKIILQNQLISCRISYRIVYHPYYQATTGTSSNVLAFL